MPGMNSGVNVNNPLVTAAFKSALLHQGIIAIVIFAVLGLAWIALRAWLPAGGGPGAAADAGRPDEPVIAEPAWRQLLRLGIGIPSQVIKPVAASSPTWVQHLVNWAGTTWSYHPMQAGASTVWIQIGIGVWI